VQQEAGGWAGKVISHNCHFFTFGYFYTCPTDGNIKLMVITATKEYSINY